MLNLLRSPGILENNHFMHLLFLGPFLKFSGMQTIEAPVNLSDFNPFNFPIDIFPTNIDLI